MASTASTNIVNSYYQAILRFTPSADLAAVYAAQLDAGTLTALQLENQLLSSATASTIPGILTYDLLYNVTPGPSGVTYLANYATALQSGNYTFSNGAIVLGTTNGQYSSVQFSLQNVYVNLGATFASDPKSTFAATYGGLSEANFINQIYAQIFGHGPGADTQQFLLNNFQYYINYAGSTIGGYGAIAGLLLYTAEQGGYGSYPAAANALLAAAATSLANTGTDTAAYGTELVAQYGSVPANSVSLTTGKDSVTANLVLADLTPFLYNGIGPTLNVGDSLTGVAGKTNNTFIITDQYGTGTDVIPAGVSITNVQTIDLNTQGNAGGSSPASQGAGGTTSGVFDVTTSAATTASTISGLTTVNVTSAGQLIDNIRVDPGSVNPVNVTVNHQHVNGTKGGVAVLGGNNVTVNDGDGAIVGGTLVGGINIGGTIAGGGVTIGSYSVVNQNNIALNPTGTVLVNEIGDNIITIYGGSVDTVNDSGGGSIFIGDGDPLASLNYPTDEPGKSVTITDNTNVQAGTIQVYAAAPVTNNGTTTPNATTVTINETSVLANAITVGVVDSVGGINYAYAPAGNDTINVTAQTPVAYNYATATQTGIAEWNVSAGAKGALTAITVVGGATVGITTDANSVVAGAIATNGNGATTTLVPVAYENATGPVTINDTAVVGAGAGGASVTDFGGTNVTINNAGGAVTIGAVVSPTLTITNSGTQTVTDAAPLAYDDVLNTGTARNVTTVGGTTVAITTNAGGVSVGTAAAATGSEPTGTVTVVDTASPGVNAGGKAPGTDVPITVDGGTNVFTSSANGSTTIGAGTKASNPSGTVTAVTAGIETGGQFASTTTVNGAGAGSTVYISTTGAGGAITAGVKATPLTGTVGISDTFAGTQNADSVTVTGGVATTGSAVSITTTKSSGAITVGGYAPVLNTAGTALANASVFANGNVVIVNETPANTGVAGAANLWGTGASTVNTNGATSVAIAGGAAATITDEQTTPATGGPGAGKAIGASTLASVFLDHVGLGGQTSTITSDAVTSLTVLDDTAGDGYTVVSTPALALSLLIGNDAGTGKTTTVTDATASSVAVTDNGKATAGTLKLAAAKATSASFANTTALKVDLTASTALTALTLTNTGALNLGSLAADNVAITAGSGSTGAVTITNLNGATSSFSGSGSTGNDSITLTSNVATKGIRAGGGTTNTITANYGAGAGDSALSSITSGFNVLGVGVNGTSGATKDTITVTAIGAVGATYTVNVTVNGVSTSFTYTQVAGDTTATVAAAMITGLNAKLAAAGVSAFVAPVSGSTTAFNVIAQAGAQLPATMTTVATVGGGTLSDVTNLAATNAYNAIGFSALTVGALAGPVTFSNVGSSETLNITADPGAGNSVTLQPTASTNTLTVVEGTDGPATGATAGSAPITHAVVNTVNTQSLTITSQGQGGTTKNLLTVNDPALAAVNVGGDESLTLTVPALDPAFPGVAFAVADSAFSSVATINAGGTSISTQPGSKNVTDVTGVVVAASGVSVNGGASQIKAAGVQGLDFAVQTDTISMTGDFAVGQVVTATITPTYGYSVAVAGPNIGKLVLGPIASAPIVATYTVQASDLSGGTTLAHEQAVAAQLAAVINGTAGLNVAASAPTTSLTNGQIVLSGTTNTQQFTDGGLSSPIVLPIATSSVLSATVYTKAADNYVTGSGGGVITLGTGGGFNPYATVTANSKTYYGVYDTGYEQLNLAASTAKTDTINVTPSAVATFGGVNGSGGQNGGVTGFQETAAATADQLSYTAVAGYTVIANIAAASTLNLTTGQPAANMAAALDPSGNLANALANVNFSSSNGLITVVGNGNSQPPSAATILAAAEIIVALAAGGTGAIAAVSNGAGSTYVVAAQAGNNFVNFNSSTVQPTPAQAALEANSGLSVVQLLGSPTFTGFGSFQSVTSNPLATLNVVGGLGAGGAVLADVVNQLANKGAGNNGVAGTSKVYSDAGYSLDQLTASQTAAPSTSTTFNNLAPASQLNINSAGNNVGTVVVTQSGAAGSNSLIVDLLGAGETVQSLTTTGDWAVKLVADASSTVSSFTDASNALTTLSITGGSALKVGTISDTALTTIDASAQTGALTLTGVSIASLAIKGALGGDTLTASGLSNTITVGTAAATGVITGAVAVTAAGNADTITLVNSATGNINNLNVGGVGDTISVDTGTNNISGGLPGAVVFGLAAPLQTSDIINLADGGTDNVWVGGSSTVNLTGNQGTSTFGAATTAFNKGGIASTANIAVKGDVTGTTSSGFATGGTGALTTITGADVMGGTPLNIGFLNTTTEAFAGGTAATAFVNVEAASSAPTTLAAALDADVSQSLVMDAQIQPGADTQVLAGVLNLNAKTGLLSWFQFQGNTYVVEATNGGSAAAAHSGLLATDTVVKLTGLVDLSHSALAGGIMSGL